MGGEGKGRRGGEGEGEGERIGWIQYFYRVPSDSDIDETLPEFSHKMCITILNIARRRGRKSDGSIIG